MSNGKTIRDALRAAGKTPKKPSPYTHDTIYDLRGQLAFPGQVTKIPSGNITMQGVPYPVYGQDNLGNGQMMYPGMNYTFPGQYVTEYPMAAYGGDPSLPNITGHYQKGGPSVPPEKASESSAMSEEDLFDNYYNLKQTAEAEKKRVEEVRKKAASIAASKAESKNPNTRTDLSYIKTGAFYCNTHTGECLQDAGATTPEGKPVPVIPGNLQWDSMAPGLGFEWVDEPQPGDVAREQIYRKSDYQGNPLSPGFYSSHSGVVTQVIDPNDPSKVFIGNAPGGVRNKYVNETISEMVHNRPSKDYRMKYQRYVGNIPKYEQELADLQNKISSLSTNSMPMKTYSELLSQQEPELQLKKTGGWLDTMQEGGTKPWGEMTPKERAAYLDAKEANKKAETKSRAQAKKEHINDYVINSTKKALTHPMFSAPAYLTPQGAMIGAGQSVINASRNIYDGNYKTAAFDALGVLPLLKQLKNIPKSFKPNIKGKFEGVGSTDDVKQLSAKPTYENNPYTFRDPQSNQPIYQTDPADFQNFKNSEMINEAKTHYKNASNKWLNTEGVKRSGHTDVPEFNDELKYIKDQAQYGKRPLLNKNNIGTSKEYDIYRNNLEQWKKNTNQQEEGIFDFFNKNKEDLTDPEMLKIFPKPQPKNFYIKGDEKRSAFVAANELTNKEVPEAVKYFNNPDKEKVVSWMKTGDPKDVIREMNPRKYKNLDQMNNQQLEKARQEVYNDFINSWKNSLKNELSNTYTGKQAFNELTPNKFGGESDDEEYRRGGSVNPLMRSRSKRASTKKNIQSSINKIFLRNYDLFGPGGKNIYDPKAKYQQGGGWLDNLD